MHITSALLDDFTAALQHRGHSPDTAAAVVSIIRAAAQQVGTVWNAATDFTPFLNASAHYQGRTNRHAALTHFARWATITGHGTIIVPQLHSAPNSAALTPAPVVNLAQILQRIAAASLPLDVQAIFLLLAEAGLLPGETLMLNLGDVTICQTQGLLRVGDPVRIYPLTTIHTPATIPAMLGWYQERSDSGSCSAAPLFLTRQHSRRTLMSLHTWWRQVVGSEGPSRTAVYQARRADLHARYPTIMPSLLGDPGAPTMRADTLRQILLAGDTHDA